MSTAKRISAPYKGLVPYLEEDAEFFFGREHERNFITSNLLGERLTLLYGASGVGKSSVLRAGVEHDLKLLAKENVKRLGKPKYLVVVFTDWRDVDPIQGVLRKVREEIQRLFDGQHIEPVDPALGFADALLEWSKRIRGQLLIILDQFEEYFLYHADEDGTGTFSEEFPRAVNALGLPANFLVSFREDAFSKLAFFKVRMPEVFGNYLQLEHLNQNAGRDAIVKPINQYNRKLANGNPAIGIEPSLIEEVLKQVETGQVIVGETGRGSIKKDGGGAQIETPFLQMVMMRLWEEEISAGSSMLRLGTLQRLANAETGETGAERIVRTHLDQKMNALRPEKQDIAAEAFHYLVTPSGTKIAHTASDLADYAKLSLKTLRPLLEDLSAGEMRILRAVSRATETRYEIFHDVLAVPILDWRSRRVKANEQAAAEQKAQMEAREEEKARTARLRRVGTGILALLLVIAAVLAVWAVKQSFAASAHEQEARAAERKARDAAFEADRQRKIAEDNSEKLKAQSNELVLAKQAAENGEQSAIAESKKAKASAAKERKEKRSQEDLVKRMATTAPEDFETAEANFRSALELVDKCEERAALINSQKEFQALDHRYGLLGNYGARARQRLDDIKRKLDIIGQPANCP